MNNKNEQLLCPDCGLQNMREAKRFEVEIDACMNCFGIWFDAGEILRYVRGRKNLAMESHPPKTPFTADSACAAKPCPRCRNHSLQAGFSGELAMSYCTLCKGLYLPQSTHKQIFVASGTLPPRPKLNIQSKTGYMDDLLALGSETLTEVLGHTLTDIF